MSHICVRKIDHVPGHYSGFAIIAVGFGHQKADIILCWYSVHV